MIGVLGSGFGLYGHIPALVELGHPIKTLARYRAKLASRPELAALRSKLNFVETEADVLADADAVVLARRPEDNLRQALSIKDFSPRPILVMEKPLASTPHEARLFLQEFAGTRLLTPFLLRWCSWAPALQAAVGSGARQTTIKWGYSPAGTSSHWKTDVMAGGGPLGFYFIHLIAFVTYLFSRFTVERFTVEACDLRTTLKLEVKSGGQIASFSFEAGGARTFFLASADDQIVSSAQTPFGPTPQAGMRDPRIDALKRFYAEEVFGPATPSEQDRIVGLWAELRRRADSFPALESASNVVI